MARIVEFEGLLNVRDLGGLESADGGVVRPGALFRGDQLAGATDADIEKLAGLGIVEVVDLRSAAELREKPDKAVPGARYVHLPVIADVRTGVTRDSKSDADIQEMIASGNGITVEYVEGYMRTMYRMFVADESATAAYRRFVDEVLSCAEQGQPIFWHCTAGKDRAGFAAAVLLEALGVPRQAIVEDYMITNARLAGVVEPLVARLGVNSSSGDVLCALRKFFLAGESFLAAAYEAADELYGGFEGFLREALGVDDEKRAALKSYLVCRKKVV